MSNLTIDRFERAAQRFEQAESVMVSSWKAGCKCLAPGEQPQCWNCPSYKGLGRLIQRKLHTNPNQAFAEILPPEYEDPYCDEVRQQCCDMYANDYPIQEIQRLAGIPSRRILRDWLREVGLPGRSAHYPEAVKQKCLKMYADRLTARQIEEETGVPADTITDWAMHAKITRRTKYPAETKQQCIDLYQSGQSSEDIHAMTGIPALTIRSWIADAEVGRAQKRYSKEDRKKCQDLYRQGQTAKQIEALTGILAVTVRSWMRKERWKLQKDSEIQTGDDSTQVLSTPRKVAGYWQNFDILKSELLQLNEARGQIGMMPTAVELKQLDRGDVAKAISRHHGGFQTVAEQLGFTYRKKRAGYWHDFENVKDALFAFIHEHGIPGFMPTKTELEAAQQGSLCMAVERHGGFPVVAKQLKLKLTYDRKPRGYWKQLDNLRQAINEVSQELGHPGIFPTHEELKQLGRTDLINAIANNGGWSSVAKRLGLHYSRPSPIKPPRAT